RAEGHRALLDHHRDPRADRTREPEDPMNTARDRKTEVRGNVALRRAERCDLVFGLGDTGLSVARYLKRCGRPARYIDTRENPPGMEELERLDPSADVMLAQAPPDLL